LILKRQILGYIEDNGLLSEFQSRFRCNNSTIFALLKVTDYLDAARVDGEDTVLVLLDFYKAFDCIPPDLLVHKFRVSFGVSPSAASLIASFLAGRSMLMEADGVRSTPSLIKSGVPQYLSFSGLDWIFHFYVDD
jgi:Reverse transcriptase (RNA-dependent DNA polymerase)